MDALAGLLAGPRARGAFLLRAILNPPWAIRIEDRAPLTLVAVERGEVWVLLDGEDPVRLRPGDIGVVRGPHHYTIADAPTTPPRSRVLPGGCNISLDGEDLCASMELGVRTWGDSLDGSTTALIGTYQLRGDINRRLLDVLPGLVVLRDWDSPIVSLLGEEVVRDAPGQEAVLDRLLDLLLVAVLRTWFTRQGDQAPAWYRAHLDPVVGRALRLLHESPGHSWTVGTLAARSGVSRALLARRFTELVGEPPMAYLTNRRLSLAADLLRDPETTVDAVARQVGYASPFALSTAFKRVRGISPQQHRLTTTHPQPA
ncbi:AraC family transcriptional regulator [Rhizohabitans arisaemae]|uniref:AraC family transcriptional regulator n=1 Tax=Rhizohabitans arisaemae TaxID=2720610 RepID=UPI0024B0F62C|nr:AraC family transcriptional regulator [Rhizohabitans arisaemae]